MFLPVARYKEPSLIILTRRLSRMIYPPWLSKRRSGSRLQAANTGRCFSILYAVRVPDISASRPSLPLVVPPFPSLRVLFLLLSSSSPSLPRPGQALTDDLAGEDVKGSKQRGGASGIVIVWRSGKPGRRGRIGVFGQGLNLAYFIDAEHRAHPGDSDTVPPRRALYGLQVGVVGEFEFLHPMGLQIVALPSPVNGHVGHSQLPGQGAPVGGAGRRGVQRRLDQLLLYGGPQLAARALAYGVMSKGFTPPWAKALRTDRR